MNHQERFKRAALAANKEIGEHISERTLGWNASKSIAKATIDAYLGDTVLYRLQCNMPSKVAKHYEPCYVRVLPTGDNE